jgi:hypothetical protein
MLTINQKLKRNFATSKIVMLNTKLLSLRSLLILCCIVFASFIANGQVVGDYRSAASGLWTAAATWQTWNGAAWVAAGSKPGGPNNVTIRNGHIITFSTSAISCNDLIVDVGGKLYSNSNANNFFLNVTGDTIMCNGTIGNSPNFDGISFNIDGDTCRILGTGVFDASRLRKSQGASTTNLYIERDVKLRFGGGRQTQIYNNGSIACRFNVTVAAGATLMLDSTVSADCPTAIGNATSTIISGLTVNANNPIVNIANTSSLSVGQLVTGPGVVIGSTISSIVANVSITLSQNAFQTVSGVSLTFGGNIVTTTSLITVYSPLFTLPPSPNSLIGCRVSGAGIAPNATITSVTGTAPNFVLNLSIPNTGNVTGPLSFISDGNAAMDGKIGASGSALSGNYIINGTMVVTGLAYFTNNNSASNDSVAWIVNNGGVLKVGNTLVAASGAAKNILRVMPGGKFEVFGLPGFASNILPATNGLNNVFDIQTGSFTEFSGLGSQNVPVIPSAAPSSGWYGNLKISGFGTKTSLSTPFRIKNNFDIVNSTGAPVFNATASTNFFVGGNWSNYHDSAFTEGATFVSFDGVIGIQTITCPSGEMFSTLRYQKGDATALQMNSDVKVKNQFSILKDGFLNLNGKTLTLYSNSNIAISGGNTLRYIYGETPNFTSKVKWYIGTPAANTVYRIPFSKAATVGDATPFGLNVNAGVTVDTLVVSTYGTPATNLPWPTSPVNVTNLNSTTGLTPDNRDATADRFWYVNFTAPTIPAVDMDLTYASGTELPVAPFNNPASIQAQYWSPLASNWMLPPMGIATLNVITINNPPINGVWTLVNNLSPLPIELLQFNGKYQNNSSLLYWSTASETDNDYFVVERSNDGNHFYPIGTVDGAGNSSVVLSYSLRDYESIDKVAYYRLKQVDFDGRFTYSKIIALRNMKSYGNQYLNLYPQPASTDVFVEQGMFVNGETFSTEIFNTQGALVQRDLHTSDESGNLLLHLKNLEQGMYMLRITDGVHQLTKPLIIQ